MGFQGGMAMNVRVALGTVLLAFAGVANAQMNALPQARHILVYGQAQARAIEVRIFHSGEELVLRVRDDGPGIDERFATHLFDAFQRGENSRSRAQGGSGLGLAVVRAIALAHGGAVTCRRMENGGTLFELSWHV